MRTLLRLARVGLLAAPTGSLASDCLASADTQAELAECACAQAEEAEAAPAGRLAALKRDAAGNPDLVSLLEGAELAFGAYRHATPRYKRDTCQDRRREGPTARTVPRGVQIDWL